MRSGWRTPFLGRSGVPRRRRQGPNSREWGSTTTPNHARTGAGARAPFADGWIHGVRDPSPPSRPPTPAPVGDQHVRALEPNRYANEPRGQPSPRKGVGVVAHVGRDHHTPHPTPAHDDAKMPERVDHPRHGSEVATHQLEAEHPGIPGELTADEGGVRGKRLRCPDDVGIGGAGDGTLGALAYFGRTTSRSNRNSPTENSTSSGTSTNHGATAMR